MKLTAFIFVVAAVLLFASSSSLAQTQETAKPTSEVEQLKQRLQQFEQTVTELKGQIEAIETKKTSPAIVEAKYSETTTPPAETTPAEPAKPQGLLSHGQRDDRRRAPVGQARENFLDGFKSDDFRIQFSFRYNFSKTFTY
jgi:hypothetical protein